MLAILRQRYQPLVPHCLHSLRQVHFRLLPKTGKENLEIAKLFPQTSRASHLEAVLGGEQETSPKRVGVVFSGGQAAGGHNVIAGLFHGLKQLHHDARLFGFLDGPAGVVEGKSKEIHESEIAVYMNQGGFDFLGSGRIKIETEEQFQGALSAVQKLHLDGLVIIGGDDSNTNAAVLAEFFLSQGQKTAVIGIPKTIDGDLQHEHLPISFGFDTACKVYSELIGNIERDVLSAKKYTHFIKLMGRTASHIALECALKTHPNLTLIGEEILARKMTLAQVVSLIADLIVERAEHNKNYSVILIPEGLIEFIPEMQDPSSFPEAIQKQLQLEKDPHGNINVSLIETDRLLIELVTQELKKRKFTGKFTPVGHFFGYEGRAGFPSNFDSTYCYALGLGAACLINQGATGVMCCLQELHHSPEKWTLWGVPITSLLHLEMRKGKMRPVIAKALVDLQGKPFLHFADQRAHWRTIDDYQFPGPIQFFGEPKLTDEPPLLVTLNASG